MVVLNIERKKSSRRVQQIVWVRYETFQWILSLCSQLDIAPNTVIAELLDRIREYANTGVFQPIKVIEKEIVKGYKCPYCNKVFDGSSEFIEHLVEHRDMLKQIVEVR